MYKLIVDVYSMLYVCRVLIVNTNFFTSVFAFVAVEAVNVCVLYAAYCFIARHTFREEKTLRYEIHEQHDSPPPAA